MYTIYLLNCKNIISMNVAYARHCISWLQKCKSRLSGGQQQQQQPHAQARGPAVLEGLSRVSKMNLVLYRRHKVYDLHLGSGSRVYFRISKLNHMSFNRVSILVLVLEHLGRPKTCSITSPHPLVFLTLTKRG